MSGVPLQRVGIAESRHGQKTEDGPGGIGIELLKIK